MIRGRIRSHRFMAFMLASLFVSSLVVVLSGEAQADDFTETPVTIVPVANAPVVITKCKLGQYYWQEFADVTNRTHHSLLSVTFRFTYFDTDGAKIGTADNTLNIDPPLTGGDSQLFQNTSYANLSEPQNAIARMTCRMQAAAFSGLKKWSFGQVWNEPLSPVPKQESLREGAPGTTESTGSSREDGASHLTLVVSNAWNDKLNGNLFVHAAIDVRGGNANTALRPAMLTLEMAVANGKKKSYKAISQPAPTYQKLNPLANTTQTAFEVDPKEDLGRLGSVVIPAHGAVHLVVTFFLGTDGVVDPSDNRRVALQ